MDELLTLLKSLENELHHNGNLCNLLRVKELLHQDFFEVGKSGRLYDRSTVIRILGSQDKPPSTISDNFELNKISENVALLTYRSASCLANGELVDHALRSSVWSYTNKKWQLLYHQGTLAAEAW